MDFKSFDGKRIHLYEWLDVKEPKGVVQIVHGMAEHAARYEGFARYLNERGYLVVADDHRGHGRTDFDSLGYCKGNMYEDTLRDEAAITDYFQKKYAGLAYFLFGFSYGSFLAQSYIGRYGDKLDGAVIGGGNYKKDAEVYFGKLVAGFMSLFVPKKPGKFIEKLSFGAYAKKFEDGEWLSVDPENNARYREDPSCGFTCSYRFYSDFFGGLLKLYTRSYTEGLRRELPILLVSGENDAVGDLGEGVKKLFAYYEENGMNRVEMKLFENSRHEFLNEKGTTETARTVLTAFFDRICEERA